MHDTDHQPAPPARSSAMPPTIAISMGDPHGIGPEVLAKALADPARRSRARWIIFGDADALATHAPGINLGPTILDAGILRSSGGMPEALRRALDEQRTGPGSVILVHDRPLHALPPSPGPTVDGGARSFNWVRAAIDAALAGVADAIVTGPISKHAWHLAGHGSFPGHTELLAHHAARGPTAMMFHARATPGAAAGTMAAATMNVILATTHIPLARVATTLTTQRVLEAITLGAASLLDLGPAAPAPMGTRTTGPRSVGPRIAVCGLNPHAGEEGLLGDEDARIIAPAVASARAMGLDVHGPLPADTLFDRCIRPSREDPASFDLVVAMYHDQGLIPLKLLARDRAVNRTVGLAFPRTSPDHGTAYDIARSGRAHPGSMAAALDLAVDLALGRATSRA